MIVVGLILAIVAPIIARPVQLAVSRSASTWLTHRASS